MEPGILVWGKVGSKEGPWTMDDGATEAIEATEATEVTEGIRAMEMD